MWTALDIFIGLTLCYALISLFCTAIQEFFSQLFDARGQVLAEALAATGIDKAFPSDDKTSRLAQDQKDDLRGILLLDPVKHAQGAPNTLQAAAETPTTMATWLTTKWSLIKAYLGGRKSLYDMPVERIAATLATGRGIIKDGAIALPDDAAIDALPIPPGLKTELKALSKEARASAETVKKTVELWVDGVFAEIKAWSERRAQVYSLFIGLGVALAFNIDTIQIAQSLANDPAKRAAVVALAETVNKDGGIENCPVPKAASPATETENADETASGAGTDTADSAEAASEAAEGGEGEAADSSALDQPIKSVEECLTAVENAYPFPLGWASAVEVMNEDGAIETKTGLGAIWKQVSALKVIGILFTGLALSLGSLFWFDMLKSLLALRSASPLSRRGPAGA